MSSICLTLFLFTTVASSYFSWLIYREFVSSNICLVIDCLVTYWMYAKRFCTMFEGIRPALPKDMIDFEIELRTKEKEKMDIDLLAGKMKLLR